MKKTCKFCCVKFLSVFFVCCYLFLSVFADIDYWKTTERRTSVFLILGASLILMFSLYIFKSLTLRTAILGGVCVLVYLLKPECLPFIASPFSLVYLYKTSIVEKNEKVALDLFCFVTSLFFSCLNIAKEIENYQKDPNQYKKPELVFIGILFSIILIFMIASTRNYFNSSKQRTKKLYTLLFIFTILGILGSSLAGNMLLTNNFRFNPSYSGNLPLSPWFFFLLVMLYENDEVLMYFSYMLFKRIHNFLDLSTKNTIFNYYQK